MARLRSSRFSLDFLAKSATSFYGKLATSSQLRKLREIMDHIYALFDRRCRTQTALGKLKKLRQWVERFQWIGETFKKVFSPHLENSHFTNSRSLPSP